jgi:mannose-6-phosphate isomerase-like protein (cupin superfamily)
MQQHHSERAIMKSGFLAAAAITLLVPAAALTQSGPPMPVMNLPTDPFAASSPLSKTRVPLAERIAHGGDPSRYVHHASSHNGSGPLDYMALFDGSASSAKFNLGVNLFFLHRGVLPPGGGIGEHFHNYCEEMFVILDGEAEYSIDSRTSVLRGPAGAVARLGHSHAITNQSDKTVQWMNINVGLLPHFYDASNLDDGRVGAPKDSIPQFITMHLDKSLDQPIPNFDGGTGTVMYHRGLDPSAFYTSWSYVDHLLLPPGTTVGPRTMPDMAEVYYVISGEGTASISGDSAPIHTGDAIPAALGESRSFAATGKVPLEFMIIGIARDLDAKRIYMLSDESRQRTGPR